MSTGIKRTFFPIRMFLPVLIPLLVLMLIYGSSFFHGTNEAQANVAKFSPAHCLGGWKNVDNIAGQPDVRPDNDTLYDDTNSASLYNANAQVFCGGFSGDIPYAAKHEKVTLHFSWYIGDGPLPERTEGNDVTESPPVSVINERQVEGNPSVGEAVVPEADAAKEELPVDGEETTPAVVPEGEVEEDVEEVAPTKTSEPTALHFLKQFVSVAHAQDVPPEVEPVPETVMEEEVIEEAVTEPESPESVVVETASSTTPDTQNKNETIETGGTVVAGRSSERSEEEQQVIEEAHEQAVIEAGKPENAYFEVLYTLDGQEWHTLGFVNRIANDVQIELPIDLFATVDDLQKVQIALHTVERFDTVPKIYLDALWLEVAYDDVAATEMAVPGERPGDIIFSKTSYGDGTAVVVLRNVELMTLSNVLAAASSSTSSRQSERASTSQSAATSTQTNVDETQVLTNLISTSTLAGIINSTGVLVELWLYSSTTDNWSRVADDSIMSRNPQVKFINGNIFWVDKNNLTLWRHNPSSGGYDALSFSEGQVSKMPFSDESGEPKELEFIASTSSIQLLEVSVPKPSTVTW